jgi:putative ABC transport system ATP-binding protein
VLKSVDFDAEAGEVTMVMGPSGSGKSTLIAALSGLLRPDEGKVTALDQDLWALRPGRIDRFRLDHCGFIFQGFNLFPALTALQQVTTVLKYQGLSRSKARDMAAETLTEVGLGKRLNQRPSELSAGRSSGWPSPARWPNSPRSCSRTSPPRRWTARTARSSSA